MSSTDPNKLFRVKLGQGEPVLRILLSEKPSQSKVVSSSASTKKLTTNRVQRRLRRRDGILPRAASGYINFYDLGQLKDGVNWVDLDFGTMNEAGGVIRFREVDWNALADLILGVPIEDWKTEYRKLEYTEGEKYGVDLREDIGGTIEYSVGRVDSRKNGTGTLITGNGWTEKGLKIVPTPTLAESCAFVDWGLFFFLELFDDDTGYVKITTTYDPTATSVIGFSLSRNANVYLMPRPVSMRATRLGTTNSFGTESWQLVYPFRPLSREFWLERSNGTDFLPNIFSYNETEITLNSTNSSDLISLLATDPDTRFFHTTWPSSTPTIVELMTDPGGWETVWVELEPDENGRIEVSQVEDPAASDNGGYTDGILTGVIEQNGTFYYVWRVSSGPVWYGGGGPVHKFTLT